MARAATPTKLSLYEWAAILGIHPLHFCGVSQPTSDPGVTSLCSSPWPQYPWQRADRMARDDLAIAIAEAEAQLEEVLGYHLMPAWDYDEWRPTARPYRPELVVTNMGDIRGFNRVVFPDWAYFISGGVEQVVKLSAAQAVTYTDEDGDGYKERATITITTTLVYDPNEVEIHLPDSSEAGEYDEKNRIRPIQVHRVDNGGGSYTFTIRCRREQLVLWDKLTILPPTFGVPGDDDPSFAVNVEVWRHYNDPSTQATLLWELSGGCDSCGGGGCTNCQYQAQTACLNSRSAERTPIVSYSPSEWDPVTQSFSSRDLAVCRDPDIVRLFYRSGWQNLRSPLSSRFDMTTNKMDRHWAQIVAQFAASKLERPACDCEARMIDYWAEDLAYVRGANQLNTFSFSSSDIKGSPFGTRRGAVMAWNACQSPAVGRAVLV